LFLLLLKLICFSFSHQIELTRERLSALLSHEILVKIWDGKEYCTVRTKLDKPRIARALPNLLSSNRSQKIVITIRWVFFNLI
jgi:hypothetical protein